MDKKAICLIAARGGSKGVPGKNIKILAGKPLIAHSIISIKKSKIFSKIIVSTDDVKIAAIAKKYGAEVPFLRPKNLAKDNSKMDDVIFHAISKLKSDGIDFDVLVNKDCTAPFIQIKDLEKSVKLIRKTKVDLVVAAYKSHLNPYFNMMELNNKGFLKFSKKSKNQITSRQSAPIVFQLTSFQTINVNQFLKYKKIYMPKAIPYEIPIETGLMIDTKFEFELAKCMSKFEEFKL
jgi:CMP-N-acetylneuraminic acid synthetase